MGFVRALGSLLLAAVAARGLGACTAESCTDDGNCETRACQILGPADPAKKEASGFIISCTG
ncbi:unnamed protein product [Amoebophrya sp. A25]|nr:unnamed protein product [Amoebophrya sp. A25]|eukprot:GSA25T00010917001.1